MAVCNRISSFMLVSLLVSLPLHGKKRPTSRQLLADLNAGKALISEVMESLREGLNNPKAGLSLANLPNNFTSYADSGIIENPSISDTLATIPRVWTPLTWLLVKKKFDDRKLYDYLYATFLRKSDINAFIFDKNGNQAPSPLMVACEFGLTDDAMVLLRSLKANPSLVIAGRSAMSLAAGNGNLHLVKVLAEEFGVEVRKDASEFSPLHAAANGGHMKVVEYLLKQGADINGLTSKTKATPILLAADQGHFNVVAYLLSQDKVNVKIVSSENISCLECLIRKSSKSQDLASLIAMFKEKGADLNLPCSDDNSLLVLALLEGNLEAAIHLLRHGADPNKKGRFGQLAAVIAARENYQNFLTELALKSAHFDQPEDTGTTALGEAIVSRNAKIVEFLLQRGVNPNKESKYKHPLILASSDAEIVHLLLIYGANPYPLLARKDFDTHIIKETLLAGFSFCFANAF